MSDMKKTLEQNGLKLEELELCNEETHGALEITFQLETGRRTSYFDGHRQALVKAYWECVKHPKVLLFQFV